jgi:hypothetical protein
MDSPKLPKWVAPFCCIAPYCALIGLSFSAAWGANVGTPALIALVLLCGKTTGWVLNNQPATDQNGFAVRIPPRSTP